jgi:hypothetical protein
VCDIDDLPEAKAKARNSFEQSLYFTVFFSFKMKIKIKVFRPVSSKGWQSLGLFFYCISISCLFYT